jgi:hypothetical protein
MQTNTKSWDVARETCQNLQGELAAVTDIGKIQVRFTGFKFKDLKKIETDHCKTRKKPKYGVY